MKFRAYIAWTFTAFLIAGIGFASASLITGSGPLKMPDFTRSFVK